MISQANLSEVKSRLSEYTRKAEEGETTILTTNGRPVAQLGPIGGSPDVVGSGSGWLLVATNLSGGSALPIGFTPESQMDVDLVMQSWQCGEFKDGILWVHQTSASAVLAVPTGGWSDSGVFAFFLWRGAGRVFQLEPWSEGTHWHRGGVEDFTSAKRAARAIGNAALGIGRRIA